MAAAQVQATFAEARGVAEQMVEARGALTDALKRIDVAIAQATRPVQTPAKIHPAFPPLPAKKRPSPVVSPTPAVAGEATGLATAQRKILNALAFLEQVGYATPDRTQVSLFAGLSPTAGHTSNMFGGLRTAGLIEYLADSKVRLTAASRALADPGQVPQTAEEMQTYLLGRVAAAQRKLLTVLIAAYPEPIDKREAAERAGLSPDAGHTSNMLGGLRSMGIIDYPEPKMVVALPVLFLEGRGMKGIARPFAPRTFWNVMVYACGRCGHRLEFYLEDGCEGPRDVEYDIIIQSGPRSGEPSTWWKTASGRRIVPVPFVAGGCPTCQGKPPWSLGDAVLQHVEWERDRTLDPPVLGLPAGTARFHYPADLRDAQACGMPIFPPYAMRGQA